MRRNFPFDPGAPEIANKTAEEVLRDERPTRHRLGARVWVSPGESSAGLLVRSGTVVDERFCEARDGRLVRHDNGSRLSWSARTELITLSRVPWTLRLVSRLLGYLLPLWWRLKRRLPI